VKKPKALTFAVFSATIRKINKELGVTIIMVSHDLHAAVANADHILHLSKANSFFGTTEEYLMSDIYKKFGGEGKI
jgi:zinc transport system ATP-binding protein